MVLITIPVFVYLLLLSIKGFHEYQLYKSKPILSIFSDRIDFYKGLIPKEESIHFNEISKILNNRHNRLYIYLHDDRGIDLSHMPITEEQIKEIIDYIKDKYQNIIICT